MKERLANGLLSLAVILLLLAVLEGGSRLWEWRHPPEKVADYLWDWRQKWDDDFYVFESDAVGWPPWEEFNADGVRDRTHAAEKPEGVRRIVFLGDSVTLGDGIRPDQAYPQQLDARFQEEGRLVEVFNVGLLGWSTRQERIAYTRIVRRYQPDQVVLAVCLNDIPELQNNLSRPPRPLAWLHGRSALVRRLVRAQAREIGRVEELFEKRDSPKVRQAMARFFQEVRKLRDEVRADGGQLAMIVFPFRFQLEPGAPPPGVQEEIGTFAAAEAIPALDLLPALRELGVRAFVDYDHLSPAGARRVAHELAVGDLLQLPRSAPEVLAAPRADAIEVRWAEIWRLGRTNEGGEAAASALREALRRDPSERVRAEAARGLGRRGDPAAAYALFDAVDDPRAAVRWSAASALLALQPPAEVAVPRLTSALRHADPYIRGFATWTLGNYGAAAAPAVPALVEALTNDEAFGRSGAAAALAKIGPAASAAVPALLQALKSAEVDRRWKAARALGRIGATAADAVPALIQAARTDHEYVRAQAIRALARIAPAQPDVIEALKTAAKDADPEVRRQADLAIRGR
jgi:HEAT repeat protein